MGINDSKGWSMNVRGLKNIDQASKPLRNKVSILDLKMG